MIMTALNRTVPFSIASRAKSSAMKKPPRKKGIITESLIRVHERKFLNHAIHVLELGERDRLLRVEGVTTGPGLY